MRLLSESLDQLVTLIRTTLSVPHGHGLRWKESSVLYMVASRGSDIVRPPLSVRVHHEGIVGVHPAITQMMNDYAHACFNSIMIPNQKGREHNQKSCSPFDALIGGACAAIPVQRKEYTNIQWATDAYWKEWDNLESREGWKWEDCPEWKDVSNDAIAKGEEAHERISNTGAIVLQ